MPKARKPSRKLRILCIGAHPDDCEFRAAGTAALWAQAGHTVRFVSVTNGATGSHEIGGIELARRRTAEAAASARVIGIESQVMDLTNGEVEPSLYYRKLIIKLIREFAPDLILTHRPNDYHPDHRYTSQLVQDSAYVITVPNNLPTVPALRACPHIAYAWDGFQKPTPFQADVVVAIDAVIEKKIDMLDCHVSQVYEWMPWNAQIEGEVPKDRAARRVWLAQRYLARDRLRADQYRAQLRKTYGARAGAKVQYAEAFEFCEYGAGITPEKAGDLFPG